MLGNGDHVQIGPYTFLLDETVDSGSAVGNLYRPHYKYNINSLFPNRQGVAGAQAKDNLRPERTVWYTKDWSGGEGFRAWDESDPTVYNYSYGLNTRIPGQVTGRPARTLDTTSLVTNNSVNRPRFANAAGKVWCVGGNRVSFASAGGASWTNISQAHTLLNASSSSYVIDSLAGDDNYLYFSAHHGTTRITLAHAPADTAAIVVQAEGSSRAPFAGMCVFNRQLFCWTGARIYMFKTASWDHSTAMTANLVGTNVGIEVNSSWTLGVDYWSDLVAGDTSLYGFFSHGGKSVLYEGTKGKGSTYPFSAIWNADTGFTIKSIAYQNGIVTMVGSYGSGHGAIWEFDTTTRTPQFVTYIRKQTGDNEQLDSVAPSYGKQTLVASGSTGIVYVYDTDFDQVTALDDLATTGSGYHAVPATDTLAFALGSQQIGDVITTGNKRLVAIYDPSGTTTTAYQLLSYADDEPANRQKNTTSLDSSAYMEMGYWDGDLPFERKALMGFEVTFDAASMDTGSSFILSYALEGGTSFTALTTVTSATTGASTGRVYLPVSTAATFSADNTVNVDNTVKFNTLKWRLTVAASDTQATYYSPIIKSVAAEIQTIGYAETWDLILRIKNPQAGTRGSKNAAMVSARKARDALRYLAQQKTVVTFLDGYRYAPKLPGVYSTHTVTLEDVGDIVIRNGEGSLFVTLRAVPV